MIQPNEKISERERLLKLIDGDPGALHEAQKRKPLKELAGVVTDWWLDFHSKIRNGTEELLHNSQKYVKGVKQGHFSFSSFGISSINKGLIVILVLLLVYVFFDLVQGMRIGKNAAASIGKTAAGKEIEALNPLEYYLDRIQGKDIFNVHRVVASAPTGSDMPKVDGLKFVGVDWGNTPTAMIEDLQSAKTYFVKKDDMIKELKVVEILKDRVIVGFKEKFFELK